MRDPAEQFGLRPTPFVTTRMAGRWQRGDGGGTRETSWLRGLRLFILVSAVAGVILTGAYSVHYFKNKKSYRVDLFSKYTRALNLFFV